MVRTSVLIVQIVGMFPYVEGEQGSETLCQRIASIGFLRDDELTIFIHRQPHPTRAEEGCSLLLKLVFECLERAELRVDELANLSGRSIVCLWCTELCEIQIVVQYLSL